MMKPQKKDQNTKGNVSISAAALQQHLVQKLSLGNATTRQLKTKEAKQYNKAKQRNSKDRGNTKDSSFQHIGVEKVIDPVEKPTLAQKLGIVEAPELPLTEDQWNSVKSASNNRQDSASPCAICQEPFAFEAQVLLSCSHVFHHVCLKSFERLSGKKSCPMCRKQQYQSRLIYEGAKIHLHNAATRLQACWRGYVVRRMYQKFRSENPPKDKGLRKKFFEAELAKLTDKFLYTVEKSSHEADVLIAEIENGLDYSRKVLGSIGQNGKGRGVDWELVQSKAIEMDVKECPICLMALNELGTPNKTRPIALLSCSHLYHYVCLQTYEECNIVTRHQCPICRASYIKKKF